MKAWRLALLLVLPLALSRQIRAETAAASGLPPQVALELNDVKLTPDQAARFGGLRHDFDATAAELRRKIAAHELPHWRLETLERDFAHAAAGLLTPQQRQLRLIHVLQMPMRVEFLETPLKDVLEHLEVGNNGLQIHLDRPALRRAKMSGQIAVTLDAYPLTLDSALHLMLRQLRLAYVAQNGVVLITTEPEAKRLVLAGAVDTYTLSWPIKAIINKRLAEALRKPARLQFAETSIKDVVDYLKDVYHVEFQFDERAMKTVGIEDMEAITCDITKGSLEDALKQVLGPLKLKCVIRDEVLLITADPAAKPQAELTDTEKPDHPRTEPCAAERDAVDRLDRLGADATLNDAGQVTGISMSEATDGDAVLAVAARLPHLQSLDLPSDDPERCRITDRGLALLPSSLAVPDLTLAGDGITDRGAASLAKLNQLKKLSLYCHKITDRGLASLSELRQLQALNLDEAAVTDAGLVHLAKLPDLETLLLSGARIDGSGLPALAGLRKLKSLSLDDTLVDDRHLKNVAQLKQLQTLDLSRTPVKGHGIGQLAALAGLLYLELSKSSVTDDGLHEIDSIATLKSLRLVDTAITDAGLANLETMRFKSLSLCGTKISDAGLAHVAKIKTLTFLDLSRTPVTDAGLANLQKLTRLDYLQLDDTAVTDGGLETLKNVPKLRQVSLRHTHTTSLAVDQFRYLLWLRARAPRVTVP